VTLGAVRTTIDFGDDDVRLDERSLGVTASYHLDARRTIGAALGAILDGDADPGGDIGVGGLVAVSGSWLAVLERPRRPFVQLSASLSASRTRAIADDGARHALISLDARVGVMVGKTLDRFVPYAAARAFGGPVSWHDGGGRDAGGDRYHVTLGGGLTVRLPANLGVFVEVMPLGEQAASAGVTARF
jgi:hypothetical protein